MSSIIPRLIQPISVHVHLDFTPVLIGLAVLALGLVASALIIADALRHDRDSDPEAR